MAIGRDEQLIAGEEVGDFGLVGLQLLKGCLSRGVFIGYVLELDHGQGDPVHEQDHVSPSIEVTILDGELIDGEKVIAKGFSQIEQQHGLRLRGFVLGLG